MSEAAAPGTLPMGCFKPPKKKSPVTQRKKIITLGYFLTSLYLARVYELPFFFSMIAPAYLTGMITFGYGIVDIKAIPSPSEVNLPQIKDDNTFWTERGTGKIVFLELVKKTKTHF